MDDLLNTLGSFSVSNAPNNIYAEHPRFAQYKAKCTGSSQEERRKSVLAARKEARYDLLSHLRQMEGAANGEGDLSEDDMESESEVRRMYAKPRKYKNFLMLSEWLVDVPETFSEDYLALPCPVGKRCLVVANRGVTKVYARNGKYVTEFSSRFPGGSWKSVNRCCVLDCIFSVKTKIYYLLDVVVWSGQPFNDCDTIFRFEWLGCKMREDIPEIGSVSEDNSFVFVHIPYTDCSPESLTRLLGGQMPFTDNLDGILFYHKESHYTHGPTPLVGWLKPYMMTEIFNLPVPDCYLKNRPKNYVNLSSHIKYGEEMREKKRNERMDTSGIPAESESVNETVGNMIV